MLKVGREIAPGVHCMEVGKRITRSNVYFVRSGSSWILIDAASANCSRLIWKTAESLFGANSSPASILLTHTHPDHAGSALELARTWDCPVYVHPDELPLAVAVDLSVYVFSVLLSSVICYPHMMGTELTWEGALCNGDHIQSRLHCS
jgi:glyoxylase-like metal-dependent hydrolase (beta-lactamase superfamily II)